MWKAATLIHQGLHDSGALELRSENLNDYEKIVKTGKGELKIWSGDEKKEGAVDVAHGVSKEP